MKYLIVGLGNIGNEYSYTRHNIGFDVADALAAKLNVSFETQRYGDVATGRIKGKTLVILKPSTYMNLSGKAMAYWMQKENIALDHVLVIVDDLALPLGSLRLKERGSDAGHNGLKNIQAIVGTDAYPRLRFGIGNDFPKGFQVDFVLGKWTEEETKLLPAKIATALEIIQAFVLMGIHRTMNDFNKRK